MQLLYFPVYITLRLLLFNTKSPSMFTIIYISALLGAVSIVIYIVTQLIDNRSPSRKLGERLLDENSTGIMPFYEGRDPSHGYQHVISVTKRVIDIISDMDLLCESSYYKRKVLHAENISKNDVTIAIFAIYSTILAYRSILENRSAITFRFNFSKENIMLNTILNAMLIFALLVLWMNPNKKDFLTIQVYYYLPNNKI